MKFVKKPHNLIAVLTAVFSFIIYVLTLSPTVNFWDSGEFICCANTLQINHAPGNPTYLLLARIFSIFASSPQKIAFAINLFSAFSAAFAIFFVFKTIFWFSEKLIAKKSNLDPKNSYLVSILASIIGALSLAFSTSFWAIATEAEVYSLSLFFTSLCLWLMTKYLDEANQKANNLIVLIALMLGLSLGVHQLNILIIPALVFLFYFYKCKFSYKGFAIAIVLAIGILIFVQIFVAGLPQILAWFEKIFTNHLSAGYYVGLISFSLIFILLIGLGIYWSGVKNKKVLNLIFTSFLMFVIGYSSYAIIIIRSASNPPIDQNNVENIYNFVSYLNREQYGDRPLWRGQQFSSKLDKAKPYKKGEAIYDKTNGKYQLVHHKPVTNYKKSDIRYLPRMWSDNPLHIYAYSEWTNITNSEIPRASQNFGFMFRYQFGHMYLRYFMWNFVGKQNNIQGHGDAIHGNWISGIKFIDNFRLGNQEKKPDFLKKNQTAYYFLPFILGLIGIFSQLKFDKKNLFVISVFFIFTGIAIAFYLNQSPYQVRERDYAFLGSFYAFTIWIGLGITGLYLFLHKFLKKKFLIFALGILGILISPAQMFLKNYKIQDKTNNDFAYHFARNLLNTCDQNAILFVSGDNETFPLWYLQECENFRTDVRVINLSFLNNDWYIDQIQRAERGNKAIKLNLDRRKYISGKADILPIIDNTAKYYSFIYDKEYEKIDEEYSQIHDEFCSLLKKSGYANKYKLEFESFEEYFRNIKAFGNNENFKDFCSIIYNLEDDEIQKYYGITEQQAKKLISDLDNFLTSQILYLGNLESKLEFMFSEDTSLMIASKFYDYPTNYCPGYEFNMKLNKSKAIKYFEPIGLREELLVDKIIWQIDTSQKYLNKSQLIAYQIINENNWERPIYFSSFLDKENYFGLESYLYLEGLAYRLFPIKTEFTTNDLVNVNSYKMYDNFINKFKWGKLNYIDESIENILFLLRADYTKLSRGLFLAQAYDAAEQVISHCIKVIPNKKVNFDYYTVGLVHSYYRLRKFPEASILTLMIAENVEKELEFYNSLSVELKSGLTQSYIKPKQTLEELMILAKQYEKSENTETYKKLKQIYDKTINLK